MSFAQDWTRSQSNYLPVFKAVAIAGSLWNAGSMTTAYRLLPSIYPTVQHSRKLATNEWAFYYGALSRTVPITDLATILICGGVAYVEHKEDAGALPWKLWATAAGLMPLGWVWVWVLMLKPSNQILAISQAPDSALIDAKHPAPSNVLETLKEFNSLLGIRALFPWAVGGLALWASLGQ